MVKFVHICLVVFLLSPALAFAAPASDASLKELVTVSGIRKLLDAAPAKLAASMEGAEHQMLQGKAATPGQQKAIDNMKKQLNALLASEFSYEKMEAMLLPVYRETFSDEEVTGIIAFYKTPAGQAFIQKMPVLTQKTRQMEQQLMSSVMPKLQAISQDFAKEMQAASK